MDTITYSCPPTAPDTPEFESTGWSLIHLRNIYKERQLQLQRQGGLCLRMWFLKPCGLNSGWAAVRPWIIGSSKTGGRQFPFILVPQIVVLLPCTWTLYLRDTQILKMMLIFLSPLIAEKLRANYACGFSLVNRTSCQALCCQFCLWFGFPFSRFLLALPEFPYRTFDV